MAITATLALTSNGGAAVIANQPATFYVTVSNSGGTAVQLTGLNTVTSAPGAICSGVQGVTSPQMTTTIPAAGSASFPVTVVYPAPVIGGVQAIPQCYSPTFVQASTSDGSVAATNVLQVYVQTSKPGAGSVSWPEIEAVGELDFQYPSHSALFANLFN